MAKIYETIIDGELTQRGMWLYVWCVHVSKGKEKGKKWLYVGCTRSRAVYQRIGENLEEVANSTTTKRVYENLKRKGIKLADCKMHKIISYGTINTTGKIDSLETKLYHSLKNAGYSLLNNKAGKDKNDFDDAVWKKIHAAFSKHFPKMKI